MAQTVAIILAAGISSRMNTRLAKVLHEVCGRPMLSYVLDACRKAGIKKIYVVIGYSADEVKERFSDAEDVVWVEQKEQKGTADAVLCCSEDLKDFDGNTLVLCGDGPLIRPQTLEALIRKQESGSSAGALATAVLEKPSGYGRIVRDEKGNIRAIVEDSDCTGEQREINEINPSYYIFDNQVLFEAAAKVKPDNVKGEYYLTDAISRIIDSGGEISAVTAVRPEEAKSINSRAQLSEASKIMQQRIQQELMQNGVTIVDPDNTWIDARAQIGQDTIVEPFTYIYGEVTIGRGCRIGPFAYVRSGTVIENDVVLGVFTEVNNSRLCSGVRARHHSYIGDAVLGRNVNIGAGTITANFDGEKVSQTRIGDESYIGSGVTLIAPLDLKSRSFVEPGTTVSKERMDAIKQKTL